MSNTLNLKQTSNGHSWCFMSSKTGRENQLFHPSSSLPLGIGLETQRSTRVRSRAIGLFADAAVTFRPAEKRPRRPETTSKQSGNRSYRMPTSSLVWIKAGYPPRGKLGFLHTYPWLAPAILCARRAIQGERASAIYLLGTSKWLTLPPPSLILCTAHFQHKNVVRSVFSPRRRGQHTRRNRRRQIEDHCPRWSNPLVG